MVDIFTGDDDVDDFFFVSDGLFLKEFFFYPSVEIFYEFKHFFPVNSFKLTSLKKFEHITSH